MATRFVKCSYQEVVDLHTESDRVTAIGIHTPTGDTPRKMFKGYFDQYKKYKYYGASIKFVPAARLPADIEGVSYAANEPGVDPRDLMNPILVHGCHGNDMGTILNKLYGDNNDISDSADRLDSLLTGITQNDPFYEAMERLYYKALTDNTWKKANVQRGFKKTNLRPLVYSLAVNHQIMPGFGLSDNADLHLEGGLPTNEYSASGSSSDADILNPVSNENIKFFTPRLTRLGWMDTRQTITSASLIEGVNLSNPSEIAQAIHQGLVNQVQYSELEKLFMLMILLPPAYKTEVHFRCIISHHFAFKDFRGISFMPELTGVPTYHGYEWQNGAEVPKDFPDIEGVSPNPDAPGGGGDVGGSYHVTLSAPKLYYGDYIGGVLKLDRALPQGCYGVAVTEELGSGSPLSFGVDASGYDDSGNDIYFTPFWFISGGVAYACGVYCSNSVTSVKFWYNGAWQVANIGIDNVGNLDNTVFEEYWQYYCAFNGLSETEVTIKDVSGNNTAVVSS